MTTAHLFIGGTADGLTLDVPNEAPYYRCPIKTRIPSYTAPDGFDVESSFKTDAYRREEFRTGHTTTFIYILDSMNIGAAFSKLINEYTR
tara:strand:- start:219 stop:488 length:270 start_codon:yes stop_codon:yes gene_type:complete